MSGKKSREKRQIAKQLSMVENLIGSMKEIAEWKLRPDINQLDAGNTMDEIMNTYIIDLDKYIADVNQCIEWHLNKGDINV